MSAIRFGIIGAGWIANTFAEAVSMTEDAELAAIASSSPDRASAFAVRHQIPQAFSDYEEMLQKADIDAVYIATTHNFHMEQIRLCLKYKKHILCEKSMVLTAADAREAFRLAKAQNCFLMEAMWSRFLPQYQKAKEWIDTGRIGKIQLVSSLIGFKASSDPQNRIINPELAGGALYDIGVYAIEPLTWLIGEPVTDVIGVWRPHPVTGVDERVTMILRFPSCDAALQCVISAPTREYVTIAGDKGTIELPFVSNGHTIRLYDEKRELAEEFTDAWKNGFVYELREMLDCIRLGRITSNTMPPEATIECCEIYDKILRG